jgi:2-polyprenyl-3-methyl-5-hydroxy-6-metoxy-1,4-benzoquinol methylase
MKANIVTIPIGQFDIRLTIPEVKEELCDDRISFWWGLTTSSVALSTYLSKITNLGGKSVIELGCGLGLPGICAGLMSCPVTFSDSVQECLDVVRKNAILNGLQMSNCNFIQIDWETGYFGEIFDIIIGSEILYDYFSHGELLTLLCRMLSPGGMIVLAERKRLVVERFMGRLIDKGFQATESKIDLDFPELPRQEISIFKLSRIVCA